MNRINLVQSSRVTRLREVRRASGNGHSKRATTVQVRLEDLVIPTYLPAPPDKNPMFLEKRVYQGSSGKVYPLPFTDRIAEKPADHKWKAVWIENEFIRAMVLPEIGGRIHVLQDKTNGYDAIYNQPVIKPALVGLAGPWISGGIEFNWPQHHRPATFLPVDFEIEEHADGSKTIWCSDHDPMARMKGMHGVCLHPGRAYLELKVRAYNRTPFVQTFLWWANVGTRVHEAYQSFFPPDVYYVADHARRSMSEYPLCQGHYYGVNYGERGRKGVPASEVPTQFIPPHCEVRGARGEGRAKDQAANATRNTQHAIRNTQYAIRNHTSLNYAPNDLSLYANIPVPTSYMCMGSKEDFFGGYDHAAQAGIVHYANHHISPGKKQWTWGNHEFGYSWDRNLTDAGAQGEFAPYIEIMAGVYTDNQPDFSFLQPGETKSWSQYWYPIQKIGPAQHANLDAAINLRLTKNELKLGVVVTRNQPKAIVTAAAPSGAGARAGDGSRSDARPTIAVIKRDLSPAKPLIEDIKLPRGTAKADLLISVHDHAGRELISYQLKPRRRGQVPPPATEPPAPADIASADELYVTGLHLEQYRHATRSPALYWREALRRDPLDARCNNALGMWHLRRGEFTEAETRFRKAIERLTRRNANPYDGEAYYNLGLCLHYRSNLCSSRREEALTSSAVDRNSQSLPRLEALGAGLTSAATRILEESYAAFYKATWNQAWAGASYHSLAEIDCARRNWNTALDHLNRSLRLDSDNLRARNLKVLVLRKLGQTSEARSLLEETLRLDRLDWWARHLAGQKLTCDLQTRLDTAHDYARAGFYSEAIELLTQVGRVCPQTAAPRPKLGAVGTDAPCLPEVQNGNARIFHHPLPTQDLGALPLIHYTLGWLEHKRGNKASALKHFRHAATLSPDYCFPSRLEEIAILETAMRANPKDARAPYYLGNLLYDRRRHEEAIRLWERAAKLDPDFSIVWRNLGIGYFNIRKQPAKARTAYDRACRANSKDARLFFERDQLWKRLGEKPARRLREFSKRLDLVRQRDDLSIELCALYNQTGRHDKAARLVASRQFQPWEGGEGGPLGQHVRSQLALGRAALAKQDFATARSHFEHALTSPRNLSEAKHLLANQSDIYYWLGCACAAVGDAKSARQSWSAATNFKGDFQEMSVRSFSEMTYYSAISSEKLGLGAKARRLFRDLLAYGRKLQRQPAKIDYFATSLPTMLLFEDDLQSRQETTALFVEAQAELGLGRKAKARALLKTVLRRDPNHALAVDFFSGLAS